MGNSSQPESPVEHGNYEVHDRNILKIVPKIEDIDASSILQRRLANKSKKSSISKVTVSTVTSAQSTSPSSPLPVTSTKRPSRHPKLSLDSRARAKLPLLGKGRSRLGIFS